MAGKQVAEEAISKALEQLQDLAKGHNSRGTAATEVPSMRDASVGSGSSAGATQVYHTPQNSDPGSWAGSQARASADDGAKDAIEENGTDYKAGAEMVKSILSKIAKGIPLNAAEAKVYSAFAKGDFDLSDLKKKGDEEDEDEKKSVKKAKDEDKDEDEGMDKSLSDHASEHADVQKGLELSSFLAGWTDVQSNALRSSEGRILSQVNKSLAKMTGRQEDFNTELAKSIASLAEVLTLQAQRIEQLESTPARGPLSQVAPIEKSFAGHAQHSDLNKSQILDAMIDMVSKGQLSANDVVKFESTSQLNPELEQRIRTHLGAR